MNRRLTKGALKPCLEDHRGGTQKPKKGDVLGMGWGLQQGVQKPCLNIIFELCTKMDHRKGQEGKGTGKPNADGEKVIHPGKRMVTASS